MPNLPRETKRVRKIRVLECIESGLENVDDIAQSTGLKKNVVTQYVKEILAEKSDNITTEDKDAMVKEALVNYQLIEQEAIKVLTEARDIKDRTASVELWRKVQQSRDQLFKACGIYSGRTGNCYDGDATSHSGKGRKVCREFHDNPIQRFREHDSLVGYDRRRDQALPLHAVPGRHFRYSRFYHGSRSG